MNTKNQRLYLNGKFNLTLEYEEIQQPGPADVLIAVHRVGICGSDLHCYTSGKLANLEFTEPIALGHEASGTVVEIGSEVTTLKPGDKVAIETGVPCGTCDMCRCGRYNLCPFSDVCFGVVPPKWGCASKYMVHPASYTHRLPDHLTHDEGALLEPFSVGVHSVLRARVEIGDSVLICGAGTIGMVNLLLAKAYGSSRVIMTDISPTRLEIAKNMGADEVLLVNCGEEELAARVEQTLGEKVDRAIECSGALASARAAIYATKPGGIVCLVGMSNENLRNIPVNYAITREIDLVGSFRYPNTYPKALKLLSSGQIDLKPLITHYFSLDQYQLAFDMALSGRAMKIMIKIPHS